jgi:hypothetical protein
LETLAEPHEAYGWLVLDSLPNLSAKDQAVVFRDSAEATSDGVETLARCEAKPKIVEGGFQAALDLCNRGPPR